MKPPKIGAQTGEELLGDKVPAEGNYGQITEAMSDEVAGHVR
jgi:hypothetical protein